MSKKKQKTKKHHNKTPKVGFKVHKIDYPEENPIEELINLYEEEEIDGLVDDPEVSEEEREHPTSKDEKSLINIIEKSRSKRKKRVILWTIIILFALASSALAGFLFFTNNKSFETQSVLLTIEAPEKIQVGQPIEYKIKYKNQGKFELLNSRILVQYPNGFILDQAEPELDNHKWLIGRLYPGEKGEVTLSGYIVDETAQEQKLTLNLTFEPSNFHSEFSQHSNHSVILETPNIEFANSFPSNITLGQKINLETKLKNKSEELFENIQLTFNYPEKFQVQSTKPSTFEDDNLWLVAELEENSESHNIQVEGFFPADMIFNTEEDREQKFTIDFSLPGKDDQYFKILQHEFTIKVIDQAINTYLIINGTTENKNIELGDTLILTILAKNNGSQNYEDIILKTILNSQPLDILDWQSIEDEYYGKIEKNDNGKTIIWDKAQIPELQNLKPGQETSFNITIPVKNLEQLADANIDTLRQSKIEAHSELDLSRQTQGTTEPIKSSKVILNLNSSLELGAKALYFYEDGTPIGNGPLPFEVGEKTNVQVFWDISNNLHEIEDLEITTSLPDYVKWADPKQASTGELSYDEQTDQVIWTINRLPESVGEAHANFMIEITPQKEHEGKLMQLIGNSTISGKDKATQDIIVKTKNILTSALELDLNADNDGIVKP
jgi:hypothetical protein